MVVVVLFRVVIHRPISCPMIGSEIYKIREIKCLYILDKYIVLESFLK